MNDQETERKIKKAFSKITPDIFEQISSDCEAEKGKVIKMKNKSNRKSWKNWAVAVAASLAILLTGTGVFGAYQNHHTVATVSLDVNPGIEIRLNRNERVLDVVPINEDGKIVIGNMNFKNSDLEVTVNALVGSMLKNGYLSNMANSILISVDGNDGEKAKLLQEKLSADVDSYLKSQNVDGAVLSQVASDEKAEEMAEKYGISFGKAQFIKQIVETDPRYTAEDLAKLTVNELNLLTQKNAQQMDIHRKGEASQKGYIGEEQAIEAALTHQNVAKEDVQKLDADLELEKGVMVYEVEYILGNQEFEIDVDAKTGEVIKVDVEAIDKNDDDHDDDHDDKDEKPEENDDVIPEGNYISKDSALQIALNHAGLNKDSVKKIDCDLDLENGTVVYDVEFETADTKYDYEIHAVTGKIIDTEKKAIPAGKPAEHNDDVIPEGNYIAAEKAKQAALDHAGVAKANAQKLTCELDNENGKIVYEVEFEYQGYEYDYDIDAVTGKILKNTKEPENKA